MTNLPERARVRERKVKQYEESLGGMYECLKEAHFMPFVRLSINARESRCNVRHAEGGGGGSYVMHDSYRADNFV